MKKMISSFLLALLLPLLVLGCVNQDLGAAKKIVAYNQEKYGELPATGTLIDGIRVIEISANQFYFEPELIIVNKGEKIRLIISSEDVPHGFEIEGFEIPGYDIQTVIRKGVPLDIEFTADEQGVWEFICTIYCGFGHSTMKGTFVIR